MSVQDALRVAGIASLAMAVVLLLLTMHSFVSQDIPSVLDDLSGRKREREVGQSKSPSMQARATLLQQATNGDAPKANSEHDVMTELMGLPAREEPEGLEVSAVNMVCDIVICPVKEEDVYREVAL